MFCPNCGGGLSVEGAAVVNAPRGEASVQAVCPACGLTALVVCVARGDLVTMTLVTQPMRRADWLGPGGNRERALGVGRQWGIQEDSRGAALVIGGDDGQ